MSFSQLSAKIMCHEQGNNAFRRAASKGIKAQLEAPLSRQGLLNMHACSYRMKEVMIGVGIELGLLVGLPSLNVMGGWRIVFGCALVPVHIMILGLVRPWSTTHGVWTN